jgi:hypothetical protein
VLPLLRHHEAWDELLADNAAAALNAVVTFHVHRLGMSRHLTLHGPPYSDATWRVPVAMWPLL